MNRKAQVDVGIIIIAFIGILIGIAIYTGGILPTLASSISTIEVDNYTFTSGAVNVSVVIPGQAVATGTTPLVYNTTGALVLINAGNYTIADNQVVNGELTSTFTWNDDAATSNLDGNSLNISYTYEPLGYISGSGARTMARLIAVFAALSIVVVAISPTLRGSMKDLIRGG